MSTAREDAREGGVGGKLRTRQTRREQATPYDRPAAAGRGHRGDAAERRGNRWISKVVDPASTFITKGATRLFSSVFGKRLGAPLVDESPGISVEQREATSDVCDAVSLSEQNCSPEIENEGSKYKDDSRSHPDGDDISELELLLKRKTFTRAEYEHVMELLHSQTIDTQKEDGNNKNEPSNSLPADDYKKQDGNSLPQESRIGSYKFTGITSIPGPTLKIPEEDLASPAEVAKAYMGSRCLKVSPSSLCLRSQMLRTSPSFIGFAPKSSPTCSKSVVRFSGVPGTLEDGYMTPRSQGRSVISKISRSSYKHQPTVTLKDGEIMASGYPGPSTSSQAPSNIAIFSGKQVLKRSSVIESAIVPIRRIKQKSNLIASSEDVISQIPWKLLPTANASVPLHSRELEEKIFQQLDKLVPSPKGKSAEARTVSRDELPSMLSSDVLHEAASRCVAKTDALSLLNVEANGKSKISSNFHTVSLLPMKSKTENSHLKSLLETGIATEAKEVGKIDASITETRPVIGSLDSLPSDTTFDLLQRNSAFKMQAPDDSIEQEDNSWRDISLLSAPGEEKIQTNDHKSIISETVVTKRALISSEFMSDANIKLRKMVEKGVLDAITIAEVSLPPSTECLSHVTHTMSSLPVEIPVGSSEGNAVPLFTFGSKSNALVFSASMMSHSDPAGQETGASSSTNITAPVECTRLLVAEKVLVGTSSSFAPTTLPTSSNLQFVASASPNQSNGSLASNATTFSTSSTSAAIFSGSLSGAVVSTGPASVSSCSNGPSTLPAFSVLPPVQFGSGSSAVCTDCILPVVKSISTGSETKLHKDSPFVYASSSAVSSIFSSTCSSIFGFSAAASFSATTFGSSRPVFCSQPAHSGVGTWDSFWTKECRSFWFCCPIIWFGWFFQWFE